MIAADTATDTADVARKAWGHLLNANTGLIDFSLSFGGGKVKEHNTCMLKDQRKLVCIASHHLAKSPIT
jgi:hypothetical protein